VHQVFAAREILPGLSFWESRIRANQSGAESFALRAGAPLSTLDHISAVARAAKGINYQLYQSLHPSSDVENHPATEVNDFASGGGICEQISLVRHGNEG
jgi:hypothetical protein